MQINLDLDTSEIEVIEEYLEDIKFDGTPEEYFEKNATNLFNDIVKDRWDKMNRGKTVSEKVLEIKNKNK